MALSAHVLTLISKLTALDGRLIETRDRPFDKGWLIRVEMPDKDAAVAGRRLVRAAGLSLGGNGDFGTGTQVTFTVPVSEIAELRGDPRLELR